MNEQCPLCGGAIPTQYVDMERHLVGYHKLMESALTAIALLVAAGALIAMEGVLAVDAQLASELAERANLKLTPE